MGTPFAFLPDPLPALAAVAGDPSAESTRRSASVDVTVSVNEHPQPRPSR